MEKVSYTARIPEGQVTFEINGEKFLDKLPPGLILEYLERKHSGFLKQDVIQDRLRGWILTPPTPPESKRTYKRGDWFKCNDYNIVLCLAQVDVGMLQLICIDHGMEMNRANDLRIKADIDGFVTDEEFKKLSDGYDLVKITSAEAMEYMNKQMEAKRSIPGDNWD